jgi:hypothetical protein
VSKSWEFGPRCPRDVKRNLQLQKDHYSPPLPLLLSHVHHITTISRFFLFCHPPQSLIVAFISFFVGASIVKFTVGLSLEMFIRRDTLEILEWSLEHDLNSARQEWGKSNCGWSLGSLTDDEKESS